MDHFGIGAGVMAAARIYFQSGVQTGRTQSLVESVKAGDRVVFMTPGEVRHFERKCKERGIIGVDFVVCDPATPHRLFERGTPRGRTIFDHTWVERFYMIALEQSMRDVDHLQTQLSGESAAHVDTRRKAEELARWRF